MKTDAQTGEGILLQITKVVGKEKILNWRKYLTY